MSQVDGGRWIACDGKDCDAKTLAVVGLQSLLKIDPNVPPPSKGWLFVLKTGGSRHFCPGCAAKYLSEISDAEPGASEH